MLKRIKNAGFHTLVLTVDVPTASRRERQRRGGLSHPPALTPRILAQVMQTPAWAVGTLKFGMPKLRFLESYSNHKGPLPSTAHIGYLLRTAPDWDYLRALRDDWDGKLIIKGVLRADDAKALTKEGVDAIWVSNHAGRQFDAAPAVIDCLPAIRKAVGPTFPLIYDSSIEGGLDVLRAIAKGADLVMLGRVFHYGLGAFGAEGADHVVKILTEDIASNMGQMGISTPTQARAHLI
jgi:L-lactate dehydrogenase (cytochrome)